MLNLKLVIFCMMITVSSFAQDSLAFSDRIVRSHIHFPGYLEKNYIKTDTTIPGWEGFKVKLYKYDVTDTKTGVRKSAKVYTLDPSYDQLTKWIISACRQAKGKVTEKDVKKLAGWINDQSGAQFPIMGIVYEDIIHPGTNAPFIFKDGVTVFPKKMIFVNNLPTSATIDKCLHLTDADLFSVGQYSRISSTTREQYKMAGGTDLVGDSSKGNRSIRWLATVRRLYQKALSSDNNELITAWAKSNL